MPSGTSRGLTAPSSFTHNNFYYSFFNHVKLFTLAESLGGIESLCEIPALMTHLALRPEERLALGITDTLIRLSCGIEDAADLVQVRARSDRITVR